MRSRFFNVSGTVAPAGTIGRSVSKRLAGTIAAAGQLRRSISKTLSGLIALAGNALRRVFGPPGFATVMDFAVTGSSVSDAAVSPVVICNSLVTRISLSTAATIVAFDQAVTRLTVKDYVVA